MSDAHAAKECGLPRGITLAEAATAASENIQKIRKDDEEDDSPDIELDQHEGDAGQDDENGGEVDGEEPADVPEEDLKPHVIQSLELKFGERSFHFQTGESELDEASKTFFKDIKNKLAAILSMKLTSMQGQNPRIL